jgi:hypothetical protein
MGGIALRDAAFSAAGNVRDGSLADIATDSRKSALPLKMDINDGRRRVR